MNSSTMNPAIKLLLIALVSLTAATSQAAEIALQIDNQTGISEAGRLFVMFNQNADSEPRFYSESPQTLDEAIFALDLNRLDAGKGVFKSAIGHPYQSLSELPAGTWHVQALYDINHISADLNSEGNLYSDVLTLEIAETGSVEIDLNLASQIPPETMPDDQPLLRYIKYRSEILSEFWNTDIFLRAAVLLPREFNADSLNQTPVIFDVGGFRARYDRVQELMDEDGFDQYWSDPETAQMVIVFLDGEAPFGDSYQVNSANNGPYGDATWQEFMPYLYSQLNIEDQPDSRFITGCSTGGWVSLGVQIYYPQLFNGAWSFSADGVDFRYFQLIDIYKDKNALVNEHGNDRPSSRDRDGEIEFTMKQEISMENVLGRGNSFTTSSGQWGGWNAVYGPSAEDGLPAPVWDPQSGVIDPQVAATWKPYDLRLYLAENWHKIGADLQGKLHIWMGDMDNYYLNNAMHLFEDQLNSFAGPSADAQFEWIRQADHCDYQDLPMLKKIMTEMTKRSNSF